MQVVAGGVVAVDYQIHAVFVHQVFEAVLHESGDDCDIRDPGLVKLADGPLDQGLAVDFDERLGSRQIDWHHAHAEAGSQDDGAARRFVTDFLPGLLCQLHIAVQVAFLRQLPERFVDRSNAAAGRLGQRPLADEGLFIELVHNFRFM